MPNLHVVPSDKHLSDGTECWCDFVLIEGEDGNIIIHDETPEDV